MVTLRTSAVAFPSGKIKGSSTIIDLLKGIENKTPIIPPKTENKNFHYFFLKKKNLNVNKLAINVSSQYSNFCQVPSIIKAGKVKITPADKDSPAEAQV